MLINEFEVDGRTPHQENFSGDLVVIGGGMAGICCAITAARQGLRVILVQFNAVNFGVIFFF